MVLDSLAEAHWFNEGTCDDWLNTWVDDISSAIEKEEWMMEQAK